MNQTELIELAQESILMTLTLGVPVMMVGLVVGVLVALIQALTQIQETTLVFVPKIIAIFAAIFFLFPAFANLMTAYMQDIANKIVGMG
jgi:flagellar biosynthetic protein FliQ